MSKFKAGDKVYCPHVGTQIFTLEDNDSVHYPLCFTYYDDDGCKLCITFTLAGMELKDYKTPQIFHATPEMKAKLEDFYSVEFEASPVNPTSKDIIQAMLERGDKFVPCWVSNSHNPVYVDEWTFIYKVADTYFLDEAGAGWAYATPFDPRTGDEITKLPEGEYYE